MSTNENSIKDMYAAINRGDISAALKFFHPEIERVEPPGFPTSGVYRGLEEVKAHLSRGRETWAEGSCDPERFAGSGHKIVVFVHVRVRLKDKLDWIEARIADGFTFRDGKIVEFRSFIENQEALEWAGVAQ